MILYLQVTVLVQGEKAYHKKLSTFLKPGQKVHLSLSE